MWACVCVWGGYFAGSDSLAEDLQRSGRCGLPCTFAARLLTRPTHPPTCFPQFWMEARPDWYSIYAQRQPPPPQGDEEQAQQPQDDPTAGGSGGGRNSTWQPPRVSASGLLRKWEATQRLLLEARIKKRQRREAWLLQQYGGVKPDTAEAAQLLAGDSGGGCSHGGCRSCEAPQGSHQHTHVHVHA